MKLTVIANFSAFSPGKTANPRALVMLACREQGTFKGLLLVIGVKAQVEL